MTPVGGAVTMDVDGQGKIWASSPEGALRFDPATETFTAYRSVTAKSPKGTVATYGAAGDRDGNGWWAQMAIDTIGMANVKTGEVSEIKLAPIKAEVDRFAADRSFYEGFSDAGFSVPIPWSLGPRRMGTDKNADVPVGRELMGSVADQNQHQDQGDDDCPAAKSRAAGVSHRG